MRRAKSLHSELDANAHEHVARHRPRRCRVAAAHHLQLVAAAARLQWRQRAHLPWRQRAHLQRRQRTAAAHLQRMQHTIQSLTCSSSGERLAWTFQDGPGRAAVVVAADCNSSSAWAVVDRLRLPGACTSLTSTLRVDAKGELINRCKHQLITRTTGRRSRRARYSWIHWTQSVSLPTVGRATASSMWPAPTGAS